MRSLLLALTLWLAMAGMASAGQTTGEQYASCVREIPATANLEDAKAACFAQFQTALASVTYAEPETVGATYMKCKTDADKTFNRDSKPSLFKWADPNASDNWHNALQQCTEAENNGFRGWLAQQPEESRAQGQSRITAVTHDIYMTNLRNNLPDMYNCILENGQPDHISYFYYHGYDKETWFYGRHQIIFENGRRTGSYSP